MFTGNLTVQAYCKLRTASPKLARYCRDNEATVSRLREASLRAASDPEDWIAELLETEELLD